MLMEVRNHIKLMFISFRYNLSKEMVNRGSFIAQILFMILNNSAFILQWIVLFSLKNCIGGYDLNDILVLWALVSASFGFSHLFFQNVYAIPHLIVTGKLDSYIVQPKNVLFNAIISGSNPSAIGDLLYGYILIFVSGFNFYKIFMFTMFVVLGGTLLTAFLSIVGSITFWIKRGDILLRNLNNIAVCTASYPEGIFMGAAKVLLFVIVPTGFMIYFPVRIILAFNFTMLASVISITLFAVLFAFWFFKLGLKKYSSSNLIELRV